MGDYFMLGFCGAASGAICSLIPVDGGVLGVGLGSVVEGVVDRFIRGEATDFMSMISDFVIGAATFGIGDNVARGLKSTGQKLARATSKKTIKKTGTIWDNIKITQPEYPGTKIPKSFNIKINSQELWINPNATKHIHEYITRNGRHIGTFTMPISSQVMLEEFSEALTDAVNKNGLKLNEMIYGGGWEYIIVPPRKEGLNYVVKHARYNAK